MKMPNKFKSSVALCVTVGLLSGCFGGGSSSPTPTPTPPPPPTPTPTASVEVSGIAAKGIIKNGVVKLFRVNADGTLGTELATTVSPVLTDNKGNYTAEVSEDYQGAIKIEITPGSDTKMVCDVIDGCGNGVAFGSELTLDQNFKLAAVTKAKKEEGQDKAIVKTNVTPLTDIAAAIFEQTVADAGTTQVNAEDVVKAANKQVAQIFKLGDGVDVSEIPVIDITSEDDIEGADAESFQAAAVVSAIAAKAVKSENVSTFLQEAAKDIAQNKGTVKAKVSTTNADDDKFKITLEDTVAQVKTLNDNLQTKIQEKIDNSTELTDQQKQEAKTKAQQAFQNNDQISAATAGYVADAEEVIEVAEQNQTDRTGDELDADDIEPEPTGPVIIGKLFIDTKRLNEDGEITFDPLENDTLRVENDTSSVATLDSITPASFGTATIVDGKVKYVPNADFNGQDTINYTVKILDETRTAKITFTVNAQSDTMDHLVEIDEDNDSVQPIASHSFSSIQGVTITQAPANGTAIVQLNDANDGYRVVYTPNADFNGSDSLTYAVTTNVVLADGTSEVETGSISYTVNSIADALDDSFSTLQFVFKEDIDLLANDKFVKDNVATISLLDGSNPVQSLKTQIADVIIEDDGTLTYQPLGESLGTDEFSYQVTTKNGATETAKVTVTVTENSAANRAIAMVDDIRTWGAYMFPDKFTGPRDLVEDTEQLLDAIDAAMPVFSDEVSDLEMIGDVANLLESITDDILDDVTDLAVFETADIADYDASITGKIVVVELMDGEASYEVDLAQDGVTLKGSLTLILPDEETDSTVADKTLSLEIVGKLDAGSTSIEISEGKAVVVIAGADHASEEQNEVLEINFDLAVHLMQDAIANELDDKVEFSGELRATLVKGQEFTVINHDTDDGVSETEVFDLYLPSNITAKGAFKVNDADDFEAALTIMVANAKEHKLAGPIEIFNLDEEDVEAKLEDENNWLNVTGVLAFYANPNAQQQGEIKLTVRRVGYDQVEVDVELSDSNSELHISLDSDEEGDLVIRNSFDVQNGNGLVLEYNEDGIGEVDDTDPDAVKIVAIISDTKNLDANGNATILATFEQSGDIVTVYYTTTNRFETLY